MRCWICSIVSPRLSCRPLPPSSICTGRLGGGAGGDVCQLRICVLQPLAAVQHLHRVERQGSRQAAGGAQHACRKQGEAASACCLQPGAVQLLAQQPCPLNTTLHNSTPNHQPQVNKHPPRASSRSASCAAGHSQAASALRQAGTHGTSCYTVRA